MVITIRLYPREPDLVALYKNPNFNFNAEMKSAVLAYASGEPHTIKIPPPPEDMKTMVPIDSAIVTHIYLHEEKDKDAINAIHTFRYGYINDALKILFRSYLEFPYLEPLYTESNYRLKTRARKKGQKRKSNAGFRNGKVIPKPDNLPKRTQNDDTIPAIDSRERNGRNHIQEPAQRRKENPEKDSKIPSRNNADKKKDIRTDKKTNNFRRPAGGGLFDMIDGANWN